MADRFFVAVEISQQLIDMVIAVQHELRATSLLQGRYPRRDQMHLTLQFIGQVDLSTLDKIVAVLKTVQLQLHE